MDGIYYLVGENSPAMLVIQKQEAAYKEFQFMVEAFRQKHGALEAFTYGRAALAGLKFATGKPPKGWRTRKDGVSVPDCRNKTGKEISKEMCALPPGYDTWTFSSSFGEGYTHWGDDGVVNFSSVGKYGDKYVLRVPSVSKVVPEGCEELKVSEYQKIVEESKQETGK